MTPSANVPSGAKILSTLIDLYADQMGVKVRYEITTTNKGGKEDVVHG